MNEFWITDSKRKRVQEVQFVLVSDIADERLGAENAMVSSTSHHRWLSDFLISESLFQQEQGELKGWHCWNISEPKTGNCEQTSFNVCLQPGAREGNPRSFLLLTSDWIDL